MKDKSLRQTKENTSCLQVNKHEILASTYKFLELELPESPYSPGGLEHIHSALAAQLTQTVVEADVHATSVPTTPGKTTQSVLLISSFEQTYIYLPP